MTRRDKKILWVGGVLLLAFMGYCVTVGVLSLDAPPPDDADLLPHCEPLPDDQNAYGLFEEAHDRFENDLTREQRDALSEMVDGEPYDAAEAEAILQAGAETLALWQEGLERPGIAVPPITGPGTLMGYAYNWLSLGKLADFRALHLHRQGKDAAAIEQAMRIVRFGRMAVHCDGCLITYLVGASVEERGLARIRRIAREANLSEETVTRALDGVTPESPLGDAFAEAMRHEYAIFVHMIGAWKAGRADPGGETPSGEPEPLPDFALQVNRTKRVFADHLHPFVAQAREPLSVASFPPPRGFPVRSIGAILWAHATGNGVGKMLTVVLGGIDGVFEAKCRREVQIAATRLLLALVAYEQATGRLPDRLDALVPDYLAAVPRDGFDDRPFRYDRARRIIYSVGENLADNGGDALPQDESAGEPDVPSPREREDLVFRLPAE